MKLGMKICLTYFVKMCKIELVPAKAGACPRESGGLSPRKRGRGDLV